MRLRGAQVGIAPPERQCACRPDGRRHAERPSEQRRCSGDLPHVDQHAWREAVAAERGAVGRQRGLVLGAAVAVGTEVALRPAASLQGETPGSAGVAVAV